MAADQKKHADIRTAIDDIDGRTHTGRQRSRDVEYEDRIVIALRPLGYTRPLRAILRAVG